jgi:hypothetical protein
MEQCLLNGKGSEREAALLGKVERLERSIAAWRVSWEQRNEEDIDASAALAKSERT